MVSKKYKKQLLGLGGAAVGLGLTSAITSKAGSLGASSSVTGPIQSGIGIAGSALGPIAGLYTIQEVRRTLKTKNKRGRKYEYL